MMQRYLRNTPLKAGFDAIVSERALIIRWPILRSLAHTGIRPQWKTSSRASPSAPTTTP